MKKFTNESMYELVIYLKEELESNDIISFEVLNPDICFDEYSGFKVELEEKYIHRSYKNWTDLAELLFCKMLTPVIKSKNTIVIKFKKINTTNSLHKSINDERNEKYGLESDFFKINKNEEASFLFPYIRALNNVKISEKKQILNLGINKADEFEIIKNIVDKKIFDEINFTGIDYCPSAIEFAKNKFNGENFNFLTHDINKLEELPLQKADLIISIGTLQSSSLNFKLLFQSLIQNYLKEGGSIILGFPNCRWIDGEMIYGAKAPNYSYSEQSLLYKDVYFCKKYLQQKKFRVTLTGKNYLFLTATSIKKL